jgi:hypothetical protein
MSRFGSKNKKSTYSRLRSPFRQPKDKLDMIELFDLFEDEDEDELVSNEKSKMVSPDFKSESKEDDYKSESDEEKNARIFPNPALANPEYKNIDKLIDDLDKGTRDLVIERNSIGDVNSNRWQKLDKEIFTNQNIKSLMIKELHEKIFKLNVEKTQQASIVMRKREVAMN